MTKIITTEYQPRKYEVFANRLRTDGTIEKQCVSFIKYEPPINIWTPAWEVWVMQPEQYDFYLVACTYSEKAAIRKLKKVIRFN